jgi:glycosyltransferase involved in cell wall biosynthesis
MPQAPSKPTDVIGSRDAPGEPESRAGEVVAGVDAKPLVSIGMPVHDGAKYIREAIDSLLCQHYVNLELIISDNASTDETVSICREYCARDRRVRLCTQDRNVGAIANFAFVLGQARGEYFMWAACDDVWDAAWIERLVETLAGSDVDQAAYGRLLHMDEESEVLPHAANHSLFPYRGPRVIRRMRYFLAREDLGKANLIYSLFKIDMLRGVVLSEFTHDYHVVFHILGRTGIASTPDVVTRKRVRSTFSAAPVVAQTRAPGTWWRRIVVRLVPVRTRDSVRRWRWLARTALIPQALVWCVHLLPGYFNDCSPGERLVFWPLAVVKLCGVWCSELTVLVGNELGRQGASRTDQKSLPSNSAADAGAPESQRGARPPT